jgi:hypothetical protein
MKLSKLTINDIAKLGLYLDDPYGDGIRLKEVRVPDESRLAAIALVNGEPFLDGEKKIRDKYESKVRNSSIWTKKGELISEIKKNIC